MAKIDYLIIGTGVTGLSFANFINSEDYLIIEQDSSPGGYCKTIQQDGFTWDYSGHFFHFRNKEIEQYLINRMDSKEEILFVEKTTKIFFKNQYIDFPFQKNIHQLSKEDFIECLYDLFNKNEKDDYNNFEEMLYGKFGKGITNKFLKPYNEKLYACDIKQLDVDAMGRFFPYTTPKEIINNFYPSKISESYNNTFTYPANGAIQYINALLKDLNKEKVKYNSKVTQIDLINKTVVVNNEKIQYNHLISSIPFNKLPHIISNSGITSENLSCNKVLVFNLGFDKKGANNIHWCYYPENEYIFYRIGYYDNIANTNRMSLYVEIGLKDDQNIDIEEYKQIVIEDLKKAKVITNQQLISYHSVIMNPAYVHITKESTAQVNNKKLEWEKNNFYSVGRYGAWKYCSIEDNIIEAKELAEKLNSKF